MIQPPAGAPDDAPAILDLRPVAPEDLARFRDTFFYDQGACLLSDGVLADPAACALEATFDTTRPLPVTPFQRGDERLHPRHVSGPDMVLLTGNLGSLHAYLFHGARWDEGWVGFGNRIHRADFKHLALLGPPLTLRSRETRTRAGRDRIVLRLEFRFLQQGRLVYFGDQSAMFMRGGPNGAFEADPE